MPTTARAHDSKPSPAQALLPACRVTTTTCQLSDLIPQEGGRVRPFPGLATSTPLDIDDDEIREEFKPLSNVPCANGF
ncbi:MAG TPA: hypothetical protein PKE45_11395, partial [Caldilineaceae bacterium]|nr:hypothetical protein [Caldilineaceae bacterium]